jgi:hypothetical protein
MHRLRRLRLALVALAAIPLLGGRTVHGDGGPRDHRTTRLSPTIPADIAGGAPHASMDEAARFVWQEFIALNWPAKPGRRGVAAAEAQFSTVAGPRVWETFRGRVEVYPGIGQPYTAASNDYQFDAPPRYTYDPKLVGASLHGHPGETEPCDTAAGNGPPPWNNLDEPDHNGVRAALSPVGQYPGQQVLLESKVNRTNYVYVVSRGWYGDTPVRPSSRRTGTYVRSEMRAPPPAAKADDANDTHFISFPTHSMEVKAAWRRLGPLDDASHFYVSPVRYYKSDGGKICHIDSNGSDRWGLLAFHIMYKTPSAPYFVWATFEQVDNLVLDDLDGDGKPIPVEAHDGSLSPRAATLHDPYTPNMTLIPATRTVEQKFQGLAPPFLPHHQLYFHQEAAFDIPDVRYIGINRRLYEAPAPIVAVNATEQAAIHESAPSSPFQYYRLVSMQWAPMDKPAGVYYSGPDPAIYYAANVIIEGAPLAQAFSGQLSQGTSKASDYLQRELVFLNPKPNPGDPVFLNTFFDGKGYLAGGCMGCHGTRQVYGTDWSFLLDRGRVTAPEMKPD